MGIPLFIDFESKNGIHEHLELARNRGLIYPLYNNYGFFERMFFKKAPLFLQKKINFWFPMNIKWGGWKKKVHVHDSVVVTANYHTVPLVKYLNRKLPNLKIHVFYFNPVAKDVPLSFFEKLNCEIWSFDKEDCDKYNLKFNNQFVARENYESKNKKNINDVFFIGSDKGRLDSLLKLENQLISKGMRTRFHIVATFGEENSNQYNYKEYLSYKKIVNLETKTKAILDYVQDGQRGQTIRPLEAIFLNKKLITNNKSIVEESYYSKDNFFILGKDDLNDISKFINEEFIKAREIDPTYDIEGWLNNFDNF